MAKSEATTPKTEEKLFQKPRVSVIQRRLKNPFGAPASRIGLREAGWDARWFNGAIAADHIWRAKENGWQGVRPSELQDPEQIGGFQVSPDGFVVRGDKGQELLMRMPSDDRRQIQKMKTEVNTRNMRPGVMKRELADAAGKQLGDQAGQLINDKVRLVGDVTDKVERMPPRVSAGREAVRGPRVCAVRCAAQAPTVGAH
jgi:hypothetical protein